MNRLRHNPARSFTSLSLLGAALALGACATNGVSSGTGRSIMQSFQGYKDAWNRHNVSAVATYYGQSGTLTNPAAGRLSGEELKGWLGALY